MSKLTFLKSTNSTFPQVTKRYNNKYPKGFTTLNNIKFWNSSTIETNSLIETLAALKAHAEEGNVLLVGGLSKPLINMARKGKATDEPPSFFIMDMDGLPIPPKEFIASIPALADTSYILKASASQGVMLDGNPVKDGYRYHAIFQLDTPMHYGLMQLILIYINLKYLRDHLQLNARGCSLDLIVDVNIARKTALVSLAKPIVEPPFIDTLDERFELVTGTKNYLDRSNFPKPTDLSKGKNQLHALVRELRAERGLQAYDINKSHQEFNGQRILKSPIPGRLHYLGVVMKDEREGYCHYNFDDGDSGSYWHPLNEPEVIFTFKDPYLKYKHIELDPESYAAAQTRRIENLVKSEEQENFVGVDLNTGKVLGIRYKPEINDIMVSEPMSNETVIQRWCDTTGAVVPGIYPSIEQKFDPYNREILRHNGQQGYVINDYRAPLELRYFDLAKSPKYNKDTLLEEVKAKLPTLYDLSLKIHGGDEKSVRYMLNWLHYVVTPVGRRPIVALVMHGTKGSGKNLFIERVIKPMVGDRYVIEGTKDTLKNQFNSELRTGLMLVFSELHLEEKEKDEIDRLKTYITNTHIPMGQKFKDKKGYGEQAYFGTIIFGNDPGFIPIEQEDRRFRVSPRQHRKLIDTGVNGIGLNEEKDDVNILNVRLHQEAIHLTEMLFDYQGDYDYIQKEQTTADGRLLQVEARASKDEFIEAIIRGNYDWFYHHIEVGITIRDPEYGLIQTDRNEKLERMLLVYEQFFHKTVMISSKDLLLIYQYIYQKETNIDTFHSFLRKSGVELFPDQFCPLQNKVQQEAIAIQWQPSEEIEIKVSQSNKTHKTAETIAKARNLDS